MPEFLKILCSQLLLVLAQPVLLLSFQAVITMKMLVMVSCSQYSKVLCKPQSSMSICVKTEINQNQRQQNISSSKWLFCSCSPCNILVTFLMNPWFQVMDNGNLIFPPFQASDYKQEVHAQTYRCIARNELGKIQSRDVHVRAGT